MKGRYNYTFINLKDGRSDDSLTEYQQLVFKAIFPQKSTKEKKLTQLRNKFYTHIPGIKTSLYIAVTEAGYFARRPDRSLALWVTGGILASMGIAALFITAGFFTENIFYFFGIGVGVEAFTLSFFMPRRSKKGAVTAERIEGFKRFLTTTEKDRLKFHNAPKTYKELFERYLPYAMVLKVEKEWTEQFKDLFEDENFAWFEGGVGSLSAIALGNAMSALGAATTSTIGSVPPPSSSGGFSGGGFGGGGSSW